jgi:hypothetical protein
MRNAIGRAGVAAALAAVAAATTLPPAPALAMQRDTAPERGVAGTRQQLFEGWLAADAMVLARYVGIDSSLGGPARYHVATVERVWSGSPTAGRLVFKAPRGVRVRPGDRSVLLLWDRLAGAPDSYLEEAKSRYGETVWAAIGHDSLAAYLLPFANYAYPLDGDELVLRGRSPFPTRISLDALGRDVAAWETDHTPARLFARAAVAARVRVESSQVQPRVQHGIVAEWRVDATLTVLETFKGTPPEPLALRFISFPRAPRLRAGEELILFLARNEAGLYLAAGKRGVFHVVAGEVVEAARPLPEFVKLMRGS